MAKSIDNQPKPQHGGHLRGKPSPAAIGSGPVYQIRTQAGLSQEGLGKAVECGRATISRAERAGIWPSDERILRNLKAFAKKHKIAVTEPEAAEKESSEQ